MTLDDIRSVDSSGMYDAVRSFPEQWGKGRASALKADLSGVRREGYRQVVVAGMRRPWLKAAGHRHERPAFGFGHGRRSAIR